MKIPGFLNTRRLLLAKMHLGFFSFETRRGHGQNVLSYPGWSIVRPFVDATGSPNGRGGIYKTANGRLVAIKTVPLRRHDTNTEYAKNEVSVLMLLETLYRRYRLERMSPRFLRCKEEKDSLGFITSFVRGRTIESAPPSLILAHLMIILRRFETLSRCIPVEVRATMAKRTWAHMTVAFTLHLAHVFVTTPTMIRVLLRAAGLFFRHLPSLRSAPLGLVHRDLDPNNIVITRDNRAIVTDWESAVLSDPLYDLVDVSKLYSHLLSERQVQSLIRHFVTTNSEKNRFIALIAFNTVQTLSICGPASSYGQDAVLFFDLFTTQMLPNLKPPPFLYERIHPVILSVARVVGRVIPRWASHPHRFILCYHSIGDADWRFTTPQALFQSHLQWLSQHMEIVPLSTLLEPPRYAKPRVAITFDDGYADVYRNAFPIMKQMGIPATVFVIGNRDKANRVELDNRFPLMSLEEINTLSRHGWEIGFHTASHPDLRRLDRRQLKDEIVEGKKRLERVLGFQIRYVAYPKGYYNEEVLEMVKEAGFHAAFTVDGGSADSCSPLLVDRIPLEGNTSLAQLQTLMSPLGLVVESSLLTILKVKESIRRWISSINPHQYIPIKNQ